MVYLVVFVLQNIPSDSGPDTTSREACHCEQDSTGVIYLQTGDFCYSNPRRLKTAGGEA